MNNHIKQIQKGLNKTRTKLSKDCILQSDLDLSLKFIPPFSNANSISDIKLVIIGQDPTVRNTEARKTIHTTLNLDKENSLKTYLKKICGTLDVDINKEVYATNLYKCFFKIPPADDEDILTRHFKIWMDILIQEISIFNDPIIITLGEPLIAQLIHTNHKKVKYYWDYIGKTTSGRNFKCSESNENYLQKRIYPIAHQPTWSRNKFYNTYLDSYLEFVKQNEGLK